MTYNNKVTVEKQIYNFDQCFTFTYEKGSLRKTKFCLQPGTSK